MSGTLARLVLTEGAPGFCVVDPEFVVAHVSAPAPPVDDNDCSTAHVAAPAASVDDNDSSTDLDDCALTPAPHLGVTNGIDGDSSDGGGQAPGEVALVEGSSAVVAEELSATSSSEGGPGVVSAVELVCGDVRAPVCEPSMEPPRGAAVPSPRCPLEDKEEKPESPTTPVAERDSSPEGSRAILESTVDGRALATVNHSAWDVDSSNSEPEDFVPFVETNVGASADFENAEAPGPSAPSGVPLHSCCWSPVASSAGSADVGDEVQEQDYLHDGSPSKRARLGDATFSCSGSSGIGATKPVEPACTRIPVVPRPMLGVEGWFHDLLQRTDAIRSAAGDASRPFRLFVLQWGAGSEAAALTLLGVPFEVVGTTDRKTASLDFCKRLFGDKVAVCYTTPDELLRREGLCFDRNRSVSMPDFEMKRPDLSCCHFPPYVQSKGNAEHSGSKNYETACTDRFFHLQEGVASHGCLEYGQVERAL